MCYFSMKHNVTLDPKKENFFYCFWLYYYLLRVVKGRSQSGLQSLNLLSIMLVVLAHINICMAH